MELRCLTSTPAFVALWEYVIQIHMAVDRDQWRSLMKFTNGSAIVSFSEMPLHSDVLKEDCSLLADRYASAVAGRSLTRNIESLEEEEEEEENKRRKGEEEENKRKRKGEEEEENKRKRKGGRRK